MRIAIDFSPKEHVYARKVYLVLTVLVLAAAAAFSAGYGAYSSAEKDIRPLEARVADLQARSKRLDLDLAEIKKTVNPKKEKADRKQVEFVNSAIRQRAFSWTLFLNRLEGLVPDGVSISSLRPNFGSMDVEITGTAESIGQVMAFIERLTGSEYFADIPPVFNTSETLADKDIGKTLQQFNIRIKYYPDGRTSGGDGAGAPAAAASETGAGKPGGTGQGG